MRYFTRTIPDGGAILEAVLGKVVTIQALTLPVELQLGDKSPVTVRAGSVEKSDVEFFTVGIVNKSGRPVDIRFAVGYIEADYKPGDNSTAQNSTYILTNGGVPTVPVLPSAKKAGGTAWAVGDGVALSLPNTYGGADDAAATANALAAKLFIPGTNYGHRRKSIVFECLSIGGGGDAFVFDSNGFPMLYLKATDSPIILETDASLFITGYNGNKAAGSFIYHEYYFANNV